MKLEPDTVCDPSTSLHTQGGITLSVWMFFIQKWRSKFYNSAEKSFCTEIFNVMRLMDEKQAKYALALLLRRLLCNYLTAIDTSTS